MDYFSLIDISALFRVFNAQRNVYTSFSQDHCAKVRVGVLGIGYRVLGYGQRHATWVGLISLPTVRVRARVRV